MTSSAEHSRLPSPAAGLGELGFGRTVSRLTTGVTGTAPIEASSANKSRHRVNIRGNRALNHAIHIIAVTQVAHDTHPAAPTTSAVKPRERVAKKHSVP